MSSLYETDFYAWTQDMAEAVRTGSFVTEKDLKLLAEEIEDLGKAEKRGLNSAVIVLFVHLLKKQFQPKKATRSWELTIKDQQAEIGDILDENPSLKRWLRDPEFIGRAYQRARTKAALETKLDEETFPETCPFDESVFGYPLAHNKGR